MLCRYPAIIIIIIDAGNKLFPVWHRLNDVLGVRRNFAKPGAGGADHRTVEVSTQTDFIEQRL